MPRWRDWILILSVLGVVLYFVIPVEQRNRVDKSAGDLVQQSEELGTSAADWGRKLVMLEH